MTTDELKKLMAEKPAAQIKIAHAVFFAMRAEEVEALTIAEPKTVADALALVPAAPWKIVAQSAPDFATRLLATKTFGPLLAKMIATDAK